MNKRRHRQIGCKRPKEILLALALSTERHHLRTMQDILSFGLIGIALVILVDLGCYFWLQHVHVAAAVPVRSGRSGQRRERKNP